MYSFHIAPRAVLILIQNLPLMIATPALIERWAHIPQYIDWLNEALGPDAYPRVRAKALPLMPQLERMSRTLFNNLIEGKALRQAA